MAKITREPKVGDILYPHYTPQKAYLVTAVSSVVVKKTPEWEIVRHNVTGVNLKGEVVTYSGIHFPMYEELYKEHLKKAETHRKVIDKFRSQIAEKASCVKGR